MWRGVGLDPQARGSVETPHHEALIVPTSTSPTARTLVTLSIRRAPGLVYDPLETALAVDDDERLSRPVSSIVASASAFVALWGSVSVLTALKLLAAIEDVRVATVYELDEQVTPLFTLEHVEAGER